MKITIREKKILLMFLGMLLFAASYFFYYKPTMEDASVIQEENQRLSARLDELLILAANREFYKSETEKMQAQIEDYCGKFPYTVRPEDGIALAMDMEKAMDVKISNVGLGNLELVYSMDGNQGGSQSVLPEETLMEKGNERIQSQINEIEGIAGAKNSEVAVSSEADVTESLQDGRTSPALYRTKDSMQFQCTYKSLKEMVKYLGSRSGRMTLDNINASFDSGTGHLTGNMTVNLYSIVGGKSTYTQPDTGKVKLGTKNIFGTIENSLKKKKAAKKTENK